jgi:hypothetical protein
VNDISENMGIAPRKDTAMATKKKTASQLTTCDKYGHLFTDFGISQPASGDHLELCTRCQQTRLTPMFCKPEQPQYQPIEIQGEMQSLWDMPIPEKLLKREQRAKIRKQNRLQRQQ